MSTLPKLHLSEDFSRFLEAPTRVSLREVLLRQSGEYDFLDFKEVWPEKSKLATHILAFANSGSGCIVVGVAERDDKTFEVKGLHSIEDKTVLRDSVQSYLPETVAYAIHDFEYTESEYQKLKGKRFQILLVAHNPDVVPILSVADGTSIKRDRIYVRHNNSSREARHSEVQELIYKRIERSMQTTRSRELHEHLSQLEALYTRKPAGILGDAFETIIGRKAGFYQFIDQMIAKKQAAIGKLLDS